MESETTNPIVAISSEKINSAMALPAMITIYKPEKGMGFGCCLYYEKGINLGTITLKKLVMKTNHTFAFEAVSSLHAGNVKGEVTLFSEFNMCQFVFH